MIDRTQAYRDFCSAVEISLTLPFKLESAQSFLLYQTITHSVEVIEIIFYVFCRLFYLVLAALSFLPGPTRLRCAVPILGSHPCV
jgi:hypothetical protein